MFAGKSMPGLHLSASDPVSAPLDAINAVGPPLGGTPISDAETFLRLVQHETPVLLRVASALVGFADAEDAAQEAILKAWQAWATLRDTRALRPWLLRIAVNICREWRRGRFGRWQRVLQPLGDDLATMQRATSPFRARGRMPTRSMCARRSMRSIRACEAWWRCATTPDLTPPRSAWRSACHRRRCVRGCGAP